MHDIFEDYQEIIGLVEDEFARNTALYGDRMLCAKGCSSCCSQMFRITLIDGVAIARSVALMDEETRVQLRMRARDYLTKRSEMLESRAENGDTDGGREVPTTGLRLPCPALIDDSCRLYDARPLVCRKWGIPLFDPEHPDGLQACELNFPPGTAIEDDELDTLVERQTEIHEKWQSVKHAFRMVTNASRGSVTIADAIVSDTEDLLN